MVNIAHFGDTPLAAYQYNAKVGPNPKTVPQDTIGKWLFANLTPRPFQHTASTCSRRP